MTDWPTPEYERPGVSYTCSNCDQPVRPRHGDKEAALLCAGAQRKLCEDCAKEAWKFIQQLREAER